MAGEWLMATANANMFTYELAPVFILMESFVLKKTTDIIGFLQGGSIFIPGKLRSCKVSLNAHGNKTSWGCRRDNFEFLCTHYCGTT